MHSILVHSGFIFFIALIPLWNFPVYLYLVFLQPHPNPNQSGWYLRAGTCVSHFLLSPMSEQCLAHDTCSVIGRRDVRVWSSSAVKGEQMQEGLGEERRELTMEYGSQLREDSNMEAQEQQSRNWKEVTMDPWSRGGRNIEGQEECWVAQLKILRTEEEDLDSVRK